ncbi:hypothetical protein B0H11DRAFT_1955587 [Mycena galericulata]|nr:hypothetical protein B0H11DRAFT_1955587 [Mycena galericulata]
MDVGREGGTIVMFTVCELLPLDDRCKSVRKLSWLGCPCIFAFACVGRTSNGLSIPGDVSGLGGGSWFRGASSSVPRRHSSIPRGSEYGELPRVPCPCAGPCPPHGVCRRGGAYHAPAPVFPLPLPFPSWLPPGEPSVCSRITLSSRAPSRSRSLPTVGAVAGNDVRRSVPRLVDTDDGERSLSLLSTAPALGPTLSTSNCGCGCAGTGVGMDIAPRGGGGIGTCCVGCAGAKYGWGGGARGGGMGMGIGGGIGMVRGIIASTGAYRGSLPSPSSESKSNVVEFERRRARLEMLFRAVCPRLLLVVAAAEARLATLLRPFCAVLLLTL